MNFIFEKIIKNNQLCLLISAFAFVALASAQPNVGENAAPEPYSYGYETDTHSAAEQKDPSGAVTGFYTLTDADGRQRRVEYVADEGGFRAKVQTNELGTKSQNSADVEVLAAPPTEGQLVYQAPVAQPQLVQVQRQQTVAAQGALVAPQPLRTQQVVSQQFYQQPGFASYGYYPGAAYGGYGSFSNGAYAASPLGYNSGYYQQPGAVRYTNQGTYSSYNNHLPSSYYRSLGTVGQQLGGGVRYAVQPAVSGAQTTGAYRSYQSGYQTLGVPQLQTSYATVPVQSQSRSASLTGSSNYIILKKKREDESAKNY